MISMLKSNKSNQKRFVWIISKIYKFTFKASHEKKVVGCVWTYGSGVLKKYIAVVLFGKINWNQNKF